MVSLNTLFLNSGRNEERVVKMCFRNEYFTLSAFSCKKSTRNTEYLVECRQIR